MHNDILQCMNCILLSLLCIYDTLYMYNYDQSVCRVKFITKFSCTTSVVANMI